MVSRDRRAGVLDVLGRLPPVPTCVVDNGSRDGTAAAVRARFPAVRVLEPGHNLGAAGRTVGARELGAELTAFVDDDSWWAPEALERAVAVFAAHLRLGLLAARVLVHDEERLDPASAVMRASPLPAPAGRRLPGPPVLGFVACGAIVRTEAFLAAGGFDARYALGGEEARLAVDLARGGWDLAYVDDVVAHHHPAEDGRGGRSWVIVRNDLWTAWLRRPRAAAARRSARLLGAVAPAVAGRAAFEAARGLPWVLRERRVVAPALEARLALLD